MKKRPSIFFLPFIYALFFLMPFCISAQVAKDTLLASQYFKKADSLLTDKKFESSIALFKKVIPIYKNAGTWERVAACYNGISENQWRNREYEKSLKNAQKALKINADYVKKDTPETAKAYANIGEYYEKKNNLVKAQINYEKALDIRLKICSINDFILATSYNKTGIIYARKRDYKKALEHFKHALSISMNTLGLNHEKTASFHNNIGIVYESMDKYDLAIAYYRKSVEIKIKIFGENHKSLSTNYVNIGSLFSKILQAEKALDYYEKALVISKLNKNAFHTSVAYEGMGGIYKQFGAFDNALKYYMESLAIKEKVLDQNHPLIANVYNNIGNTYKDKEVYEKALEYHKIGIAKLCKTLGESNPDLIGHYHNIGIVYHKTKDYNTALSYYKKGLDIILKTYGENHSNTAHSYNNLGKTYEELQEYSMALEYYLKSQYIYINVFGENNLKISTAYNYTALAYMKNKEYKNALENYQNAIQANTNKYNQTSKFDIFLDFRIALISLEGKASTLKALYKENNNIKNIENASNIYKNVDVLIKQIRKTYTNYQDKVLFAKKAREIYLGAIETQLLLGNLKKDKKYIEEAFYYAEKSKSNTLKELLNDANAKDFTGLPSNVVELEKELKIKKAFYQSQINTELSSKSKDSTKLTNYESKLFDIVRQQDSLTTILEKNHPKYHQLKYKDELITVSEIQQQLDDKTTVLEFFTTDSISYAFTISKNDINVHELSTPKLTGHIEAFRKGVISQNIKTYTQKAHALYQSLIVPVKKNIIGDKLIIIPDNSLWHLNFELLLTQKPDSDNFATMPYMLREYAITYANSANLLFSKFKPKEVTDTLKECLAFSFSDSTYTNTSATRFATLRGTGDDLPGTREEIRAISNIIDGQYYYGSQAIEANFKKNAGQYNILHLALHGEVDNERPENSKLYFTKSNDTLEDNLLYSHELFALDIPAELTVLSACNTGTGKIAKGEGIMSLGNAFQYAGTKSLLLTSWEASDKTTPVLMKNFYTNLKEGMNKGEALQQAKLQYLQTANFNEANPFYWGGFYLLGDSTPMHFDTNTPWYWVVGFLSLILIVGLVFIRKRKKKSV
ncbi:CHAT domain-containing tetratricopeptide repeat protein [Aquimarina sp. 2201CG1-2-11]|uniref:CHAT domain-containing protein n=1 Tax=Aquimarina discodermiae TaxID=3231043 RepID=UPI003461AD29